MPKGGSHISSLPVSALLLVNAGEVTLGLTGFPSDFKHQHIQRRSSSRLCSRHLLLASPFSLSLALALCFSLIIRFQNTPARSSHVSGMFNKYDGRIRGFVRGCVFMRFQSIHVRSSNVISEY